MKNNIWKADYALDTCVSEPSLHFYRFNVHKPHPKWKNLGCFPEKNLDKLDKLFEKVRKDKSKLDVFLKEADSLKIIKK